MTILALIEAQRVPFKIEQSVISTSTINSLGSFKGPKSVQTLKFHSFNPFFTVTGKILTFFFLLKCFANQLSFDRDFVKKWSVSFVDLQISHLNRKLIYLFEDATVLRIPQTSL